MPATRDMSYISGIAEVVCKLGKHKHVTPLLSGIASSKVLVTQLEAGTYLGKQRIANHLCD